MDLLIKPISSFTFDNIVSFCKEGHREGWQLDYKRDFPPKGLAKLFAAFSNTRGGVIILGVEEDRQSGVPIGWAGVANNAVTIERVHQSASSVDPLPNYELHVTDEKNGKVFILVRIFEGDATPYYVHNDANIWVRTGDITTPITQASPDETELLLGKKDKAKLARENSLRRASDVYQSALQLAEKERLEAIAKEREEFARKKRDGEVDGSFVPSTYSKELGGKEQAVMFSFWLQPFFPRTALVSPSEARQVVKDIAATSRLPGGYAEGFATYDVKPILDGVYNFSWNPRSGDVLCRQFYANGLVHLVDDVLQGHEGTPTIFLYRVAARLFVCLKDAARYYEGIGYNGSLAGGMTLENSGGFEIRPIRRVDIFREKHTALLDRYEWQLEMDTSLLRSDADFQSAYVQKIKEVHWSLGLDVPDAAVVHFLRENHLPVVEQEEREQVAN